MKKQSKRERRKKRLKGREGDSFSERDRERERGETSKIKDRIQMVALVKPETILTQKQ